MKFRPFPLFLCLTFSAMLFAASADRAAVPPQNTIRYPHTHIGEERNACMILATQASADLKRSAEWVEILRVVLYTRDGQRVGGHALTVWVPFAGGPVCVYDEVVAHGTLVLPMHEDRNAKRIAAALQRTVHSTFLLREPSFIR